MSDILTKAISAPVLSVQWIVMRGDTTPQNTLPMANIYMTCITLHYKIYATIKNDAPNMLKYSIFKFFIFKIKIHKYVIQKQSQQKESHQKQNVRKSHFGARPKN